MPHTTNTSAAKQFRSLSKAYELLGETYEASLKADETNEKLITEANAAIEWWTQVSARPTCPQGRK